MIIIPVLPSRTQNLIPQHPAIPYPVWKKNPVPAFIPLRGANFVPRDPVPHPAHPVPVPASRKICPAYLF